jgi:S-adenosylmethionine:tRNA ribosyltransferase-isomerase
MSALSFELAPALEASEPPEARGRARDDVRLMIATRFTGAIIHARFRELSSFLKAGDLLVINISATLPAAIAATRADGTPIQVRFATRAPRSTADDQFVVELRSTDPDAPAAGSPGERIALAGDATLELVAPYGTAGRLWLARTHMAGPLQAYLARHGRPIRYGYVPEPWPLSAYQTAFAAVPGSAEMPSAGRPFTAELVTELVAAGVLFAPLVLHTGVSSPERHEPPYPEQYEVPPATSRLVNAARAWGGRIIAVGTTAVRAIETVAACDGTVRPGWGWTDLVLSPDRPLRTVDGMLTGWHEPMASHLQILEALAGEEFLQSCYTEAVARGYLWHEFGDSHLILP